MDYKLINRLIFSKLCEKNTYILALIVGSLINAYGQLLVPWLRGADNPVIVLKTQFLSNPVLTIFSVSLAFAFPLCVGVYSSVTTRYRNRRIESIADFPDTKPDPVFRVDKRGKFVEAGEVTKEFFRKYGVFNAQNLLGEDIWGSIISGKASDNIGQFYFEPEGTNYIVKYTQTKDEKLNIYLTRL